LFSFLSIRIVAQNISVEEFGVYNLISFYTLILQNITDFGMNVYGVKIIGKDSENSDAILWNIWYQKIKIFSITTPIILLASYFLFNIASNINFSFSELTFPQIHTLEINWTFILASIVSYISVITLSTKSTLDIKQQVEHTNYPKAIAEATSNIAKFIIFIGISYLLSNTVLNFIIGFTISSLISLAIDLIIYHKHLPKRRGFNRKLAKEILKLSQYTAYIIIASYLIGQINKVILNLIYGDTYQTGIYSPAQKIFLTLTVIPNIVMIPVYSEITKLTSQPQRLKNLFWKTLGLLTGFSIITALTIYISSPVIIELLTNNSQYLPSIPVLQISTLSYPFMFLHHLFGYTLISFDKEKKYLWILLIGLAIQIAAGYLLGSRWQALGSSISLVVTEVFICIGSGILATKLVRR
jgi:O-antigen/teichoic acid export membrane protein